VAEQIILSPTRIMSRELPWLIGFFEGEGSVSLTRKITTRNGLYLGVSLSVGNTVKELLFPFPKRYGGEVYKGRKRSTGRSCSYRWRCPTSSKKRMLSEFIPHLVSDKKRKCKIALEVLSLTRNGRRFLTEETKEARGILYRRFYPNGTFREKNHSQSN